MTAPTPLLCKDLLDFVTEEYQAESAKPNRTHYLRLLNQAKNIICAKAGVFSKKFVVADGFDPTTNYPRIRIPADIIKIVSVLTEAGDLVGSKTRRELDMMYGDWESEPIGTTAYYIQEGMHLQLCPPLASGAFTCVVNAIANLPDFTDTETVSTTPSLYLPQEHQLLPAYYVLAELPLTKETFELGQLRVAKFGAKWGQELAACIDMMGAMGRRELDY